MLDFRILGPFEVVEGDHHLALGGPRQRALLALLVLRRGELVSSDRLIDELWSGRQPPTAAKIVQGYVSHLRKALGEGVLVTRAGGYQLNATPEQVDAERFGRAVAEARRALSDGDARVARGLFGTALAMWRGEALADMAYEPFAQDEISRLEGERLDALEDRVEADLSLGEHRELVAELEALARRHPNRERLLGQLMIALYRSGRQADALEAYRAGRHALQEQLGLEFGPELRTLERRILDQDPELDPPPASEQPRIVPVTARSTRRPVGARLIAAGAVILLAAVIAAVISRLSGGEAASVRVAPNSVAGIGVHSNRVDAAVAVGAQPTAIAYGDGSLWVANADDQTISRVDPRNLQTLRTLPLKQTPTGVTATDGAVWTVTSNPVADFVSVERIDPQFNTIGQPVRLGNVDPATPAAIASDGSHVWVAPFSGELTSLSAATGAITKRIDPGSAPASLAAGQGAVWITDSEADNVVRVDPMGLTNTIDVGHQPTGIAVGADGVWVADTGDNTVVRIDPETQAVTTTIHVGNEPRGVAVGAGSVWVANSGDGTVSRIDPRTNRVIDTIAVGGSPQSVVVAAGTAWVTVDPAVFPSTVAGSGGTLRVLASYDVDFMDPAIAYEPLSEQLIRATCAGLLTYPDRLAASAPASTAPVPEVAKSLPSVSDGGRTYTFTIRSGFRFAPPSNEAVTALTFRDTIERTLNPVMKNPVASEFDDVVGAAAYMAGKASHISGVMIRGDQLVLHLIQPEPDFLDRIAQPFFCAVPPNTPLNPAGVRVIPSAGPYTTASYVPGQGIVLVRNPNYHGSRPHWFARIDVAVDVPSARAIAEVEAGKADYAIDGEVTAAQAPGLQARFGPGSVAARAGHQQYYVHDEPQLDLYFFNTHRPLFAHRRLRLAVSYALNRVALARLGDMHSTLPDRPADQYLPPGVPGYQPIHTFPATGDLAKARALAKGFAGAKVILYTCDHNGCADQAAIVKADLAAIGLRVVIEKFSVNQIYGLYLHPGQRYDMGVVWWSADYLDPDDFFNLILETDNVLPSFRDPLYRTKLAAAARLTGPDRFLTYAKLDQQLSSEASPWVVYGNASAHELFSARVGCQMYSPLYGTDLAALCVRRKTPNRRAG